MINDTHGEAGEGWYGFDLDGTLAVYDVWRGIDHIGRPIPPMVNMVRNMHAHGLKVKILTARVAPRSNVERRTNPYLDEHWCIPSPDEMPWAVHKKEWTALEFIQDWCWRNLGFVPEITHQKDHLMLTLFDDRVVQVEPNTGRILGSVPGGLWEYLANAT